MDAVSFLSRADSMWRSLAICAGLQCDLRQIAWYSASSQELGQQRGKLLFGREAE